MVVMYLVTGTGLGLLLAGFDDNSLYRSFLMGAGYIPFVMEDAPFDLRVNDPGLCCLGIMFEAPANNSHHVEKTSLKSANFWFKLPQLNGSSISVSIFTQEVDYVWHNDIPQLYASEDTSG
jgi:hypothetical protein